MSVNSNVANGHLKKRSDGFSAIAGLSFALFVPILFLMFVLPQYVYYSGKEFSHYAFLLNSVIAPASVFIFSMVPLILFGRFSFFSFGVSNGNLHAEIKKTSFRHVVSYVSLLSSVYSLLGLLIVYFVPPAIKLLFYKGFVFNISELFPYPYISFVIFPLLCFAVNILIWAVIFTNVNFLYWEYLIIPVLFVANVLVIGFFRTASAGRITVASLLLIVFSIFSAAILLIFERRRYRANGD